MQVFVPYRDDHLTAKCLDDKRLVKQCVEAFQLINAMCGVKGSAGEQVPATPQLTQDGTRFKTQPWTRHPAFLAWQFNYGRLARYGAMMCAEAQERGFRSSLLTHFTDFAFECYVSDDPKANASLDDPAWWDNDNVFYSHRCNLVRKDPDHYAPFFPNADPTVEYVWPDR